MLPLKSYLLGALVPGAILASASQAWAGYEPHKYTEPGTGLVLEYNLYVPANYDAGRKYPLLVFLHAAGTADDLPRSLSSSGKGWTGSFLDGGDAEKYASFFLVPISQTNSSGWGDGRSDAEKFEGRLTVVVLKQLLSSAKYNLDADRLYVTGPSMGGRGSWDLIEKNPGFFAAAVPCAAPGLDDYAAVVNENIWSINGEKDSTVMDNRATIAGIRAAGGNPIYTELKGHGHDTWRSVYPTDAFMAWMYAQRRGVPWWNVSSVPKLSDPLTPGQVVVSGPTEPTGGAGAGGGGGVGGATASGGAGGSPAGGSASTPADGGAGGVAGAAGMGGMSTSPSPAGGSSGMGGGGSAAVAGGGAAPSVAGAAAAEPPGGADEADAESGCSFGVGPSRTSASGVGLLFAFLLVRRAARRAA
ncbi:MAG: hypothetical protein EOO73_10145 [Myxococcales bacterium]|nr:MAG: hypothetical protein EOO73_10145 [Myxococcales bacterium]